MLALYADGHESDQNEIGTLVGGVYESCDTERFYRNWDWEKESAKRCHERRVGLSRKFVLERDAWVASKRIREEDDDDSDEFLARRKRQRKMKLGEKKTALEKEARDLFLQLVQVPMRRPPRRKSRTSEAAIRARNDQLVTEHGDDDAIGPPHGDRYVAGHRDTFPGRVEEYNNRVLAHEYLTLYAYCVKKE